MPSEPRPKPIAYAKAPTKAEVDAAAALTEGKKPLALPSGASVGKAPDEGVWFALVDGTGKPVTVGNDPVRVP